MRQVETGEDLGAAAPSSRRGEGRAAEPMRRETR